ncbi:MAG: hypothetical protein SFV51_07240 [Bryobacteraceae bacterium]|nr:hypothetical protein [Bryobacteraceae bacterium]
MARRRFAIHPWFSNVWNNPHEPLWQYFTTLPEQAKVESGIALSAFAIAEVNGYFSSRLDNLNVAPPELLGAASIGRSLAERLTDVRGFRVEPFTKAEFSKLLGSVQDRF